MQLIKTTLGILIGTLTALQVEAVTIDFGDVPAFTDVPVYTEDGFAITTNVGEVRINNCFSPAAGEALPPFGSCYAVGNNAAQPSFGFGQGMDSKFIFTHAGGLPFEVTSIDLLEATVFPAPFSIVATGFGFDGSTVSQMFTLDGVAGSQTFFFDTSFQGLQSLVLSEDAANSFPIDIVQIDNIVATPVPAPSTAVLMIAGFSVLVGCSRLAEKKLPNPRFERGATGDRQ